MMNYPEGFHWPGLKTVHTASAHTTLERTQSQSRRLDSQGVEADIKFDGT